MQLLLTKTELYSGKVEDALGKAIDVVKEESPLVLKEFLTWRLWKHSLSFVSPLVGLIFFAVILGICWRKSDWDGDFSGWILGTMLSGIGSFVMGLIFLSSFHHLMSAVQILVASRIYIIEEMSKLLR